jgi:two-component system response regulator HydG
MQSRILVIDDDAEMADTVAEYLLGRGFRVDCAVGGKHAIEVLHKKAFDAVITDLRMDDLDGLDVLAAAHIVDPDLPVLVMTAYGSVDGALEAIRRGAYHYLTKPFKLEETAVWLERALADRGLRRENRRLRRVIDERASFHGLVGKSAVMRELYDLLERVAATASPVLVTGESGTGKELVAAAIHANSSRAQGPFVAVNCAALTEGLLESELFGHVRGAFTGAVEARRGLFVEADHGTLLLDEIGEMPLPLQAKLLRVVESARVRPVGGSSERAVDVRIVAATNRELADAVKEHRFREDLYYRLDVVPVHVPPLRARREDIPLLADHFSARFAAQQPPDAPRRELADEAVKRLAELPWPGNVRELRNIVERLLLLANGPRVDLRDVARIVPEPLPEALAATAGELLPLRTMTRRYIEWVLEQTGGNKVRAAQLLGIDASTIYRILARED